MKLSQCNYICFFFVNKARCCARCANNEWCTKTAKVTWISENGVLNERLKLVVSKTIGFQIIYFSLCTSAATSSRASPARRANTRCLCDKHNKKTHHRLAVVDWHPFMIHHVAWDGNRGQVQTLWGELGDYWTPVWSWGLWHCRVWWVHLWSKTGFCLRWRCDGRNLKLLIPQAGCMESL